MKPKTSLEEKNDLQARRDDHKFQSEKGEGEWELIDWDGNPDLKLKCWRKSFGRGKVSVGVGEFLTIVFSFGANSDTSHSATRWNYDNPPISEQEAMTLIDKQWKTGGKYGKGGQYNFIFPHPARNRVAN